MTFRYCLVIHAHMSRGSGVTINAFYFEKITVLYLSVSNICYQKKNRKTCVSLSKPQVFCSCRTFHRHDNQENTDPEPKKAHILKTMHFQ